MQLKPQQWTHHHTHRLYHMSLGLCFAFAAVAMVGVMATVWLRAGAGEVSDSKSVQITATVGGINPGPVDSPSGGGSAPVPTPRPLSVTVRGEPYDRLARKSITVGGMIESAYVFPNNSPMFSGTVSVPNGLVFITITGEQTVYSTALADGVGSWRWQSPVALSKGTYAISASVYDSYDLTRFATARAYFIVSPVTGSDPVTDTPTVPPSQSPGASGSPPPQLPTPGPQQSDLKFGLFFVIPKPYRVLFPGEHVQGNVMLLSNVSRSVQNQVVRYTVLNPNNEIVLESQDVVTFNKQAQYIKTFSVAPATPSGQYTIRVQSTYEGVTSIAADTFQVLYSQTGVATSVQPQGPVVIWLLLLLLWLLFIFLVVIAYRQVRFHTNQLLLHPYKDEAVNHL